MSGNTHVFRLPKAGNSDADYEDAYAVGNGCAAVADGATESSFARAWAEALVQGFVSATGNGGEELAWESASDPSAAVEAFRRRISPLQKAWHERIAWDRLPWFAEDKARSGAFAALITVRFEPADGSPPRTESRRVTVPPNAEGVETTGVSPSGAGATASEGGRWRALAIGDCCLFQVRDDALLLAFPMEKAEQFNSRPLLLSSIEARNERVWDTVAQREGDVRPGDTFLLASDALASWILAEAEAGARPWRVLCALQSHREFEALVARLRRDQAMRNDDVTLIRIQIPAGPESVEASVAAAYPLALYRRRLLRSRGKRRL